MGRHIAHADADNRVVAHLDGQRDEHDDEGKRLLAHAEHGPEQAEQHHDRGDDKPVGTLASPAASAQPPQEGHHAPVDGVAVVQNPESPAHDEDEDDDVGLVAKAVEERREDLPGLWGGVDTVIGAVLHHLAGRAPGVDSVADKLARRHHPRQHGGQHYQGEDNGEGMRYLFHAAKLRNKTRTAASNVPGERKCARQSAIIQRQSTPRKKNILHG